MAGAPQKYGHDVTKMSVVIKLTTHAQIKEAAEAEGRTLQGWVSRALKHALAVSSVDQQRTV